MNIIFFILGSTFLISLVAFIGMFTFFLKEKSHKWILSILVALSAGVLMGGAFLHLLPEIIEKTTRIDIFIWLLGGFTAFFLIEKVLYWHHCHKVRHVHTLGYMNLIGDSIHNFADGLIIAASFITDLNLGVVTTFAIALHEIPQEIGDYGVLLYSGLKKTKALMLNFLVALTVVLGGLVGYFISAYVKQFTIFLLPLAAGGFIYIASSDLIPELRKEENIKKSLLTFGIFLIGILIMWFAKLLPV
jgi:zinc and cadmium transporter